MGFLGKAKDLLSQKAGEFVDDKTQGQYSDTIHKVAEKAKKAVESAAFAASAATDDRRS
jgi:hypothetical protein